MLTKMMMMFVVVMMLMSISLGLRQGRPGMLPGLFRFLFYFYLTLLVMIDDDLSRTRSRHVPRFCSVDDGY